MDLVLRKSQSAKGLAANRLKTLSCSCLVSKRKNFVSTGADHFAALRGPPFGIVPQY